MDKDGTKDKVEPSEVTTEPVTETNSDRKLLLGTRIVNRNDRYYTDASWSQLVRFPKEVELNTRLLYIDENCVLYLRYFQNCYTAEDGYALLSLYLYNVP